MRNGHAAFVELSEDKQKNRKVPSVPTMPQIFRAYLKLLLGGRKQEVIARAMGVKRSGASHLLNGRNAVGSDHLQEICRTWDIRPSTMLADLARVAQNLEMGRPAGEGIGGRVVSAVDVAAANAADEEDARDR